MTDWFNRLPERVAMWLTIGTITIVGGAVICLVMWWISGPPGPDCGLS